MADALGVVNFESDRVVVEGLSQYRTIPAFSFMGRYRIIDFVLSNMVNSGMDHIKVLVKDKPRSLIEHIGNGSSYNINSKTGSFQILYPDKRAISESHNHDIFLLNQYIKLFEDADEKYVIISPSNFIYTINYNDVIAEHERTGADITCIYYDTYRGDRHFINCTKLSLTSSGRVTNMTYNQGESADAHIGLDAYVMTRKMFIHVIKTAVEKSAFFNFHDIVSAMIDQHNVRGYNHKEVVFSIASLRDYYWANMKLLDYSENQRLFRKEWPIYTTTNGNTPTYYSADSHVTSSSLCSGCKIEGTLENCVIGREVTIEKGAVLKNCLILPKAHIGENVHMEYAVVDKYADVSEKLEVVGTREAVVYIGRNEKV